MTHSLTCLGWSPSRLSFSSGGHPNRSGFGKCSDKCLRLAHGLWASEFPPSPYFALYFSLNTRMVREFHGGDTKMPSCRDSLRMFSHAFMRSTV